MNQIMSLAQNLSGGQGASPPPPQEESERNTEASAVGGDLFSALGDLDPRFLTLAMRLVSEYRSNDDDRAALLQALRPFVKAERYAKLDKAIQISKLVRVIRIALDSFQTRGECDGSV